MLVLSRPPLSSSPFPSKRNRPTSSSRATSASAVMFTIAARSFASSPSGNSGNVRYAMSVTTMPRTASPRNSRRSLCVVWSFSNAYERCVSARSRSERSLNRTPSTRSSAFAPSAAATAVTRPRSPGARRSTRSSCTRGAAASVGDTADTRSTSRAGTSTAPCAWRPAYGTGVASGPASFRLPSCGFRPLVPDRSGQVSRSVPSARLGAAGLVVVDLRQHQALEGRPSRVDLLVAGAFAEVAVAAADRTQAFAVRAVQRRERHLEHDRVAPDRLGDERDVDLEAVVVVLGRVLRHEFGERDV